MKIFVNSTTKQVPEDVNTVGKLLDYLRMSRQGTGVGINNRLVASKDWDKTPIKEDDRLTVISATYGG